MEGGRKGRRYDGMRGGKLWGGELTMDSVSTNKGGLCSV